MEREQIIEGLCRCLKNRCDPSHDPEVDGCPACLFGNEQHQITLTCCDLLDAAYHGLKEDSRIFGIDRDHIDKVLDYYQFHHERIDVCIEECSELIKALTKNVRAHAWPERVRTTPSESRQMIVDELADVLVCCGMLQQMYDISQDEIDAVVKRKDDSTISERHGGIYEIPKYVKDEEGILTINPEWIAAVKGKDDEFTKTTS